jgi:hypothetical protein
MSLWLKPLLPALQIGLHRFLHHQLQWYTVLNGDTAAVLVFRSITVHGAVQASNLDSHVAETCGHRLPLAGKYLPFFFAASDSEGGGFGKNNLGQLFGMLRRRQDR